MILGGSDENNEALFYGAECLEEVADGKIDESVQKKMVIVHFEDGNYDRQAEELRKLVVELKGICCYEVDNVQTTSQESMTRRSCPRSCLPGTATSSSMSKGIDVAGGMINSSSGMISVALAMIDMALGMNATALGMNVGTVGIIGVALGMNVAGQAGTSSMPRFADNTQKTGRWGNMLSFISTLRCPGAATFMSMAINRISASGVAGMLYGCRSTSPTALPRSIPAIVRTWWPRARRARQFKAYPARSPTRPAPPSRSIRRSIRPGGIQQRGDGAPRPSRARRYNPAGSSRPVHTPRSSSRWGRRWILVRNASNRLGTQGCLDAHEGERDSHRDHD